MSKFTLGSVGTFVTFVLAVGTGWSQEPCAGDCNQNGAVSVDELVVGVNINLKRTVAGVCPAMDRDANGTVAVGELIAAVNNSLWGCNGAPIVSFDEVQAIFNASCTFVRCHGTGFIAGGMDLEEGASFDELVGVPPVNTSAREAGLLRVDPGNSANSFIVLKISGAPPEEFGRPMPLGGILSEADVRTIRAWVDQGANP